MRLTVSASAAYTPVFTVLHLTVKFPAFVAFGISILSTSCRVQQTNKQKKCSHTLNAIFCLQSSGKKSTEKQIKIKQSDENASSHVKLPKADDIVCFFPKVGQTILLYL